MTLIELLPVTDGLIRNNHFQTYKLVGSNTVIKTQIECEKTFGRLFRQFLKNHHQALFITAARCFSKNRVS